MSSHNVVVTLATGIFVGFGLAILLFQQQQQVKDLVSTTRQGSNRRFMKVDQNDFDENQVAEKLFFKVRVLCWIMTGPQNHNSKCRTIKETWGSRCNHLIFMSSQEGLHFFTWSFSSVFSQTQNFKISKIENQLFWASTSRPPDGGGGGPSVCTKFLHYEDVELGAVALANVSEGRKYLWAKTKEAFRHIWKHYKDHAEWFLKADDDTFVIMENLRYFLSDKDHKNPVYYGARFKSDYLGNPNFLGPQGYMSGGAGYVLSKEAVRKFIEEGVESKNDSICTVSPFGAEDTEIGRCFQNVGVKAGDSRDEFGRQRFFPMGPQDHMMTGNSSLPQWFYNFSYDPVTSGPACCSETTISFHYVPPPQMNVLYQFLYLIKPFGISRLYQFPQNLSHPPNEGWDYFL